MKTDEWNAWYAFEKSGNVQDYIRYKTVHTAIMTTTLPIDKGDVHAFDNRWRGDQGAQYRGNRQVY